MTEPKLNDDELASVLARLDGWQVKGEKLHREFEFPDFAHSFGFMAAAAVVIEKMDHHPEWSNIYNKVVVELTTHDSGGITAKDVALARTLNALVNPFNSF
jgi:4a-hydroxytetrahydrobiopterin dehydratase